MLGILLARWLSEADHGAYTLVYSSVFLLIGAIHTGLFTEPMLVFGPSRHKANVGRYISLLIRGHIGFAVIAGAGLGAAGLAFLLAGSRALAYPLLAMAVAQPFILFFWMMRRSFYIDLSPKWAAVAGIPYATVMLLGVCALYATSRLSSSTAFMVMSAASLITGLWVVRRLRIPLQGAPERHFASEVTKQHRSYGPWAAATGIIMWVPGHLPYILLGIVAGMEATGTLKALRNLAMPAAHTYSALYILMVPAFVQARIRNKLKSFVMTSLVVIVGAMTIYWALLVFFGPQIMRWLYGGKYVEHSYLLWLLGAQPVVAGVAAVLGAALRALEKPKYVFWSYFGTSVGVLTIGVALIIHSGIYGAILGYVVCNLIGIGLMVYLLAKTR